MPDEMDHFMGEGFRQVTDYRLKRLEQFQEQTNAKLDGLATRADVQELKRTIESNESKRDTAADKRKTFWRSEVIVPTLLVVLGALVEIWTHHP